MMKGHMKCPFECLGINLRLKALWKPKSLQAFNSWGFIGGAEVPLDEIPQQWVQEVILLYFGGILGHDV